MMASVEMKAMMDMEEKAEKSETTKAGRKDTWTNTWNAPRGNRQRIVVVLLPHHHLPPSCSYSNNKHSNNPNKTRLVPVLVLGEIDAIDAMALDISQDTARH